jgi:hypothetical protein
MERVVHIFYLRTFDYTLVFMSNIARGWSSMEKKNLLKKVNNKLNYQQQL